MSTEVSTNKYLSNDDYFAAVAGEASTLKGGGSGKAFLKFDGNNGQYSYGAEDTELLAGTQLVMNPRTYKRGWVIWKGNNVVHEVMHLIEQGPPPAEHELPNFGPYTVKSDGPSEQYTVDMAMYEAPFVEMVFQANNKSKLRAMAALLKDFGATYKQHPGKFPVVELDSREFQITVEGRKVTKFAPDLKIVGWMSEAEMTDIKEGSPDDYEQEAEVAEPTQALEAPKPEPVKAAKAAVTPAAKPSSAPRARGRF